MYQLAKKLRIVCLEYKEMCSQLENINLKFVTCLLANYSSMLVNGGPWSGKTHLQIDVGLLNFQN